MKRILLVDDDESNRLTLSALLEDEGFEVDVDGSFAAARARLAAAEVVYDLVMLDEYLGDGVGSALLPEVRARLPAARTIMVSGSVGDESTPTDGFDALLMKGLGFPEILAVVHATLDRV